MRRAEQRLVKEALAALRLRGVQLPHALLKLEKLLPRPSLKAKSARKKRKAEAFGRAAAHRKETAAIREEVFARAACFCEVVGCYRRPEEMDHWLHGIGRRRQMQSTATCWALCPLHHLLRTRNAPSTAFWNERRAEHCQRHGLRFTPHIEHQPAPGRAAGGQKLPISQINSVLKGEP